MNTTNGPFLATTASNFNPSQSQLSLRDYNEQESHVNRMFNNTEGLRKENCTSCIKGTREHNWPETKWIGYAPPTRIPKKKNWKYTVPLS